MDEIVFAENRVTISNAREILHIAGPWVGDISVNGRKIAEDCIIDNFIFHEKRKLLFFVAHHVLNNYNYFTIDFYNLDLEQAFQFNREFDAVYLKRFINYDGIEIFYAFHDQLASKKDIFYINKEEFHLAAENL